jgi:ATP-dependent exoDNAse (exonuclease V) beta subunit
MCSLYHNTSSWADLSGQEGFIKDFLEHWKTKMGSADFSGLADRFAKFLNTAGASASGSGIPALPERFLKGKIAKLAEELVREFRPEDFGLTPQQLEECESNPAKAFEILLQAYSSRPEILQNAMKKIASRMQQKIQRGELKPQDLAREAEDIMKECTSNPAFQGMMEGFRDSFGAFADPDIARAQGREGDARLQLVRERLRKKMEQKKGGKK